MATVMEPHLVFGKMAWLDGDALWPPDAQNATETGVDEDLQFLVQVLSAPPGLCPVQESWFDIAVE